MTFEDFKKEVGTKKEWYVCKYIPAHTQIKYMITRYSYKECRVHQKPQTLCEARKFRDTLNKLQEY